MVTRERLKVTCVLNTSHLPDHTAGNNALVAHDPNIAIYSFDPRTPGLNRPPLLDNQVVQRKFQ